MNIPQPRFLLIEPKTKKITPINCPLRFNNGRLVVPTGERILPVEWDPEKQRAFNSKKYPHNSELNIWLDKMDSEIKSVFRAFNPEKVSPSIEMIKDRINERLFNKVSNQTPSLLKIIESYTQECSKIKNPNTVRTYTTTFKHLKSYSLSHKMHIDYSSINLNFYNSFLIYLMHDLNLAQDTLGKHIQVFKTFMNKATERSYNKNIEFRGRKFKRLSEPVESIFLNKEEVQKISDLNLSDRPNLERVRDLFIIGCNTGLRYSDFERIRPENIRTEASGTYILAFVRKGLIFIDRITKKPISLLSLANQIIFDLNLNNRKFDNCKLFNDMKLNMIITRCVSSFKFAT